MNEQTQEVELPPDIRLAEAREFREILRSALTESSTDVPVSLLAHRVQSVDVTTFQILLAFMNAAEREGRSVRWVRPSAALTGSAETLGLRASLRFASDDGAGPKSGSRG